MSEFLTNLIQSTIAALSPGTDADGNPIPARVAAHAPSDYSGILSESDMSSPQDYTTRWGKVVVVNGRYSIRSNIAYHIWVAQNCPTEPREVSSEHYRLAFEYVKCDIARWQIYSILASANVQPAFRPSDIVRDPAFSNEMINHLAPLADRFYAQIGEDEAATSHVTQAGYYILHSLFANAIHRAHCEGHSWLTDDATRPGSATRRCLSVLSPDLVNFMAFMEKHGHDGNHHLTDQSLSDICDAIAGISGARCADVDRDYAGRNIRNMPVSHVLRVCQSATDRWPATQLGKASMIVALMLVEAMYTHLSSVVLVKGADMIASAAASMADWLKTNEIDRTRLKLADSMLAHLVSNVFGYTCHAGIVDEDRYLALKSHANRHPSSMASGKALAVAIMKTSPHAEAVAAAVRSSLAHMATSIANTSRALGDQDTGDVIASFDTSELEATVGQDDQARLIGLMKVVRGDTMKQGESKED